jgi:Cu2+-exporting ATPase/Cu+-exporting ATPase
MNNQIGKLGYHIASHDMASMDHSEHTGVHQSKKEKEIELEQEKRITQIVLPFAALSFVAMMWDILSTYIPVIPPFPIPMELFNTILFLLSSAVLFVAGKVFFNAVGRFIRYLVANMDTLVGIGTLVAYGYSVIILLFPPVRPILQLPEYVYFDVVIVVIGFIKLGKYLELRSKLKTGQAIEKLLQLQVKRAVVKRDGKEIEVPIEEVVHGDIVLVKPGQQIPVDGEIVEGNSSVDESMVTGESMPVDKKIGDTVIGSTINKQGVMSLRATKVGSETVLSQIIALVESAQGSKAPIERIADAVSGIFVPVVLILSVISFLAWITIGSQFMPFQQAFSLGLVSLSEFIPI